MERPEELQEIISTPRSVEHDFMEEYDVETQKIYSTLEKEVAERKRMERLLQFQVALEDITANISKYFINLAPHEVDEGINHALRMIGEYIQAERGYVALFIHGEQSQYTHEWCAQGVQPRLLNHASIEHIPGIGDPIQSSLTHSSRATPFLPLIFIPMIEDNRVIGYMGFDYICLEIEEAILMNLLIIVPEIFVLAVKRKRTDEALKQANEALETRVAERTAELQTSNQKLQVEIEKQRQTEKELREAKIAAEASDTAKSLFLATISHEMRTPLTSIRESLHTMLLLTGSLTLEEKKNFLDNAYSSACHLTDLIEGVLDFSRIESGYLDLKINPVSLGEIAQSLWRECETLAKKHQIALKLCGCDQVPMVLGDRKRLRQILFNLVGNAIKFTKPGGTITISICERSEKEVTVSVHDTGTGIPRDFQDKVFDRFSRADTSGKIKGTGIGLAVSRQLVEAMQGHIWFQSQEEAGGQPGSTTFYFTVPVAP